MTTPPTVSNVLSPPPSPLLTCKYCHGRVPIGSDRCDDCTAVVADLAEREQPITPAAVANESSRRRLSYAEAVSGAALSQARRVVTACASGTAAATSAAVAAHAHTRCH